MCHSKITRTHKDGTGETEYLVVKRRGPVNWTRDSNAATPLTLEDKGARLRVLQQSKDAEVFEFNDTGIND